MQYDAFISYRHGELDGLVAEKLHKMLETYRLPRAIARQTGKKKLARVFRDREELPTSSNLSDSINEALENSAFLLLICSRRTCESQWVMREVERFGELRGKDRIITLLIEGEPDEAFPPGLREREIGGEKIFVEPLAADIRAASWADSLKLLKEEKLRLLAPILGCAFDDLRRRHRRRRIQRAAAALGAAFAFSLSFGSFATYQYLRIEEEMQQKLQNQSYVLAAYAETALAEGDPETALLLALAALPQNPAKPERPFVLAAERALAAALGVYDLTDGFRPHKALTFPAAPAKVLLSPDERYAAALYPFELAVFETASGRIAAKLPLGRSVLCDAEFLTGGIIVFTGADGLTAYDIDKRAILWRGPPATGIALAGDRAVLAAVYGDEGGAALYSAGGAPLGRLDFGGRAMRVPVADSFIDPRDTLFELSGDGGRLAVSFADGSLAVFDRQTGAETELYPPSGAVHFSGGFYRETLAFAVVETEPYASVFLVCAAAGETVARYESGEAHFTPLADESGLYVAFADQLMAVDARTGAVSHVASAGGRVETFCKKGDTILMTESGGPYRFLNADGGAGSGAATAETAVYQSSYPCHFAALGELYALTGSRDAKTVRILKRAAFAGETLLTYDPAYRFSEAKIRAAAERVVFYSYNGLRLYDLSGKLIAEVAFPEPLAVKDTQYDAQSGNVAVLYEDGLRLYSGLDGGLLLEIKGKQGVNSVFRADFGVSVLAADGEAALYDLASGRVIAAGAAPPEADAALPLGEEGLVAVIDGRVFCGGTDLGPGELIGAGRTADGGYVFAISDGGAGAVFTLAGGVPLRNFAFTAAGKAEAYFSGGFVFISPARGDAAAYRLSGEFVRSFAENGFLAETYMLGGYIAADYVSSASDRSTVLLDPLTLETAAFLPGFLGEGPDGALVFAGGGSLRAAALADTEELTALARERLGGRTLTPEETRKFNAD